MITTEQLEDLRWKLRHGVATLRGWEDIDPVSAFGFIKDWRAIYAPTYRYVFPEIERFSWIDERCFVEHGIHHCEIPDYINDEPALSEAIDFYIRKLSFNLGSFYAIKGVFTKLALAIEGSIADRGLRPLAGPLVARAWTMLMMGKRLGHPGEPDSEINKMVFGNDKRTKDLQIPPEEFHATRRNGVLRYLWSGNGRAIRSALEADLQERSALTGREDDSGGSLQDAQRA